MFFIKSVEFSDILMVFVIVVFVLGIVIDKIRVFVCGKCENYIIKKIISILKLVKMNLL